MKCMCEGRGLKTSESQMPQHTSIRHKSAHQNQAMYKIETMFLLVPKPRLSESCRPENTFTREEIKLQSFMKGRCSSILH